METTKANSSKVSGAIIIACAVGIIIINLVVKNDTDSFIMPFVLLMVGFQLLTRKPNEERKKIIVSPLKRKLMITALSISLIAGIVTLMITII